MCHGNCSRNSFGRGLKHLDQIDPLPWEIWERPFGFMQR
jgi:hypothetical protein